VGFVATEVVAVGVWSVGTVVNVAAGVVAMGVVVVVVGDADVWATWNTASSDSIS
jgi:hypothetical protein